MVTGTDPLIPVGVKAAWGVLPALSTAAGAVDIIRLMWTGGAWVALVAAAAVA